MRARLVPLPIVLPVLLWGACANEVEILELGADDHAHTIVFDGDPAITFGEGGEAAPVELPYFAARIGLRFTAVDDGALEVRTRADGGDFSAWTAPTLVFHEGEARAGHVDVAQAEGAQVVQLRVPAGKLPPTFVALEPMAEIPPELPPGAEALPDETGAGDIQADTAAVEEQGLNLRLHSRSSWGARAPRCKGATGVRMATVHHTAGANDDRTPVPVQLRQIQAFHMFTRGWCDIGYNFVVSRDGEVWEARGYGVMGAHAENANSNNMGICALGNYENTSAPAAQEAGIARALRWLHDRANIPLRRDGSDGVKGHRQRGTTSTTCPGDRLYARLGAIVDMARRGTFDEEPAPPPDEVGSITAAEESALGLMHLHSPALSADLNGDGRTDLCGRNASTIRCRLADASGAFTTVIDGPDLSNQAGWVNAPRYETLRMGDIDGDGRADLCGRDAAGLRCWRFTGDGFGAPIRKDIMSTDAGWAEPWHYATIHLADVNGDGRADVCGRRDAGFRCWLSSGAGFPTEIEGPEYGDDNGWRRVEHYGTIRLGDVNGDGRDDVCARNTERVRCWISDGTGFPTRVEGPAWGNEQGWNAVERWSTILLADVDGDGRADLCGRGTQGFRCHRSLGTSFGPALFAGSFTDQNGWSQPDRYATLRLADLDGDGDLAVCGRSDAGMRCFEWTGAGFATGARVLGHFDNDNGWQLPERYRTIRFSDVDGDGRADLCGRGRLGLRCFTAASDFTEEQRAEAYGDDRGWDAEAYYGTLRF